MTNEEEINLLHEGLQRVPNQEVNNVWLGVVVGENGAEGLAAIMKNGLVVPLMATQLATLEPLRVLARGVVERDPRQKIIIRHFSNGVDVEEISA